MSESRRATSAHCADLLARVRRIQPVVCIKCSKCFYVVLSTKSRQAFRSMRMHVRSFFFFFFLFNPRALYRRGLVAVCDKTQLFATLTPRLLPIKSSPLPHFFYDYIHLCAYGLKIISIHFKVVLCVNF